MSLSSLATPHFAASYKLGTVGIVDGSIAYLYSNVSLGPIPGSDKVGLQGFLGGYNVVTPLDRFLRQGKYPTKIPSLDRKLDPVPEEKISSLPFEQKQPQLTTVLHQDECVDKVGKRDNKEQIEKSRLPAKEEPKRKDKSTTKVGSESARNFSSETPTVASNPLVTAKPSQSHDDPSSNTTSSLVDPPFSTVPSLGSTFDKAAMILNEMILGLSARYEAINWKHDALCYGRMYLPDNQLEALVLRRITPQLQGQIRAVSQDSIKHGGVVLGLLQYDTGKFGLEGLASTDGGVLGLRGLYNFGGDASSTKKAPSLPSCIPMESDGSFIMESRELHGTESTKTARNNGAGNGGNSTANGGNKALSDRIYGRSSIGCEIYYGTLNKSGGISLGTRFSTLPANLGIPLTATATCNPLMGNFSCSYATMAGPGCSLATEFNWNIYSYESDWVLGLELWRKRKRRVIETPDDRNVDNTVKNDTDEFLAFAFEPVGSFEEDSKMKEKSLVVVDEDTLEWRQRERSRVAKLLWKTDEKLREEQEAAEEAQFNMLDPHVGVFKARINQHLRVGLVWEGRFKSLLFSVGTNVDLRRPDAPFRTLGLEVSFSS